MCGIIGFIGDLHETKTKAIFDKSFNQLKQRGRDASGIAAVFKDNSFTAIKHCIPSEELITTKEYNDIMNLKPKVVIGHCRMQTHGTNLNNLNNHPFWSEDGEWFIVHNGVINSYHFDISNKLISECDSEKILRLIETHGIEDAMQKLLQSGNSFAILAINTKTERLYNFKNKNRDCIIRRTIINDKPSIYFCSTAQIADEGYRFIGDSSIPLTHYQDTKENYLYEFNYEGYEISCKEIKEKSFVSPYSPPSMYNAYEDDEYYNDFGYSNKDHYKNYWKNKSDKSDKATKVIDYSKKQLEYVKK